MGFGQTATSYLFPNTEDECRHQLPVFCKKIKSGETSDHTQQVNTTDLVSGQLPGDGQKDLVDVVGILGRRLQEEQPVLLGVGVGLRKTGSF